MGGIEISIGKLAIYTAAAGIHPSRVLPVVLDVGTDNLTLLNDPMYLGERHARVRDERYDSSSTPTSGVRKLFPNAMLHWEDFGATNGRRILDSYAEQVLHLQRRHAGHRRRRAGGGVLRGAGGRDAHARPARGHPRRGHGRAGHRGHDARRDGPRGSLARGGHAPVLGAGPARDLADDRIDRLYDFQVPYARPWDEVKDWGAPGSRPGLADVVRHARPTMLIGTSTQAGAFTEAIVRDMAAHTERPIIMPLSNPTSKCEALPADVLAWTDGRALVATGSPFAPVEHDGLTYQIAQANNALVFPGLGLGVTVVRASRITDGMIAGSGRRRREAVGRDQARRAAAAAGRDLRPVSAAVAIAVARAAAAEGLAQAPADQPHPAGPPGHVAPGVPACRGQAAVVSTARSERKRLWQR